MGCYVCFKSDDTNVYIEQEVSSLEEAKCWAAQMIEDRNGRDGCYTYYERDEVNI